MHAAELVVVLTSRGVKLHPEGTGIRCEAPRGVLTSDLLAELRTHKAEVLAMLTRPTDSDRLDLPDCMALIGEAFDTVEAGYIEGALELLDTDADLARRFNVTEQAIDAAVKVGPTEMQLRAALGAHVEVIAECCRRKRARQERAG
jgi:hypothetical protein